MISAHFTATLLTSILIWCMYGLICLGFGWPWKCLYLRGETTISDLVWSFWIGLAVLLGLLQIWHLFLPVDGYAFCALTAGGLLMSLRALPEAFATVSKIPSGQRRAFGCGTLLLTFWIADRSTGPGSFYDSGLYHIPAMEWASQYRIVPGLANLHLRLGFTSSTTLLDAMMNQGPSAGHANHFANCFLLAALGAMVIRGMVGVIATGAKHRPDHWIMLFGALAVTEWSMDFQASSLSTDIAAVVFSLAAAACFLQIRATEDADRRSFLIFTCCTLCGGCICTKGSTIPFAGPLAISALCAMNRNPPPHRIVQRALLACSLAIVIVGVWTARQVILSGYPLFPSPMMGLHVPWQVPIEKVATTQHILMDYARAGSIKDTTGDYTWLRKWFQIRVLHVWNIWKGTVPFCVGVFALLGSCAIWRRTTGVGREWSGIAWLLASTAIALAVWARAAPDPRFSSQLFFLVYACGLSLLAATCLQHTARIWPRLVPLLLSLSISSGPIIHRWITQYGPLTQARITGWLPPGPDGDFQATPQAAYFRQAIIPPNTTVYLPPLGKDQIWDAPLPNAPSLSPGIQLRNPPHLEDGFKTETMR